MKADEHLILGLRWLAHELANSLSVLRSGLDIDEREMIEIGAKQLTHLTRCVQLMVSETQTLAPEVLEAPEGWQENLRVLAASREIELVFHCDKPSLRQARVLVCLFLFLLPKTLSGKMVLTANSTKTSLSASSIPAQAITQIEGLVSMPSPKQINHPINQSGQIPLYLAFCQGDIKAIYDKGDKGSLVLEAHV